MTTHHSGADNALRASPEIVLGLAKELHPHDGLGDPGSVGMLHSTACIRFVSHITPRRKNAGTAMPPGAAARPLSTAPRRSGPAKEALDQAAVRRPRSTPPALRPTPARSTALRHCSRWQRRIRAPTASD